MSQLVVIDHLSGHDCDSLVRDSEQGKIHMGFFCRHTSRSVPAVFGQHKFDWVFCYTRTMLRMRSLCVVLFY